MKTIRSIFLTGLTVLILAAGCSRSDTSASGVTLSSDGVSDADQVSLQPIEETVASIPEKDISPVRISFLTGLGRDERMLLERLTKEFNDTNVYGITVEIPDAAPGTISDSEEDMKDHDDDAGEVADADLVLMKASAFPSHTEDIVALDPFLRDDDIRYDDFIAAYREEASRVGFTAGLPFAMSAEVYYINRTLFHEIEAEEPQTWQELTAAGSKLMEKRFLPVITVSGASDFFEAMCLQNGVHYIENGAVGFNNADGKEALRFLVNMSGLGFLRVTADASQRISDFRAQRTGGFVGSSADAQALSDAAFDVGAVALPAGKGGFAARTDGLFLVMLAKDADVQAACWEYMKYLTTTHVAANWAVGTGYLPVRYSAYDAPEYLSYMTYDIAAPACKAQVNDFYFSHADEEGELAQTLRIALTTQLTIGAEADDAYDVLIEEADK